MGRYKNERPMLHSRAVAWFFYKKNLYKKMFNYEQIKSMKWVIDSFCCLMHALWFLLYPQYFLKWASRVGLIPYLLKWSPWVHLKPTTIVRNIHPCNYLSREIGRMKLHEKKSHSTLESTVTGLSYKIYLTIVLPRIELAPRDLL